ncbi:MAG: bacteriophage abortive infection AbiH family protein [Tannerellaceae bacterium]|jgi:hypothetical protein|nr:bacteriophage abortive infection AbiH family protein [Tannerellaceae bacterium]
MNRIILIGNGFDLAHGLKTGYKDFINWFEEQTIKNIFLELITNINNALSLLLLFTAMGKMCENRESIHIHGELNNPQNPIIFGYGDELIERLNDNDYLENMKSIKYLETENYKSLLSFINTDDYQIFVIGHSCGISDRTLLNTLFEHDNCASIKVFYHKKSDGTDNYSDIIRNISRCFNDKVKMREKVVNKSYCEPF